jgi:hypothetical protein
MRTHLDGARTRGVSAVQVQRVLQPQMSASEKLRLAREARAKTDPLFRPINCLIALNLKACCVKARPISYQIIAILDGSAPTPFVPSFCVVESKFCASGRAWKREARRDVYLRFLPANSRGRKTSRRANAERTVVASGTSQPERFERRLVICRQPGSGAPDRLVAETVEDARPLQGNGWKELGLRSWIEL